MAIWTEQRFHVFVISAPAPNKILYQLLMARFVLRNRHNVCCLNIWLPSILTAISYKRKIFQFLHLKPVLYKQSYSINLHFATDTPTQKWECCPHVINSIRCKVRRQLTIFKLLNSSANKILSDAPPQTGCTDITILNEQMVYTYSACTNIFNLLHDHAKTWIGKLYFMWR